MAEYEGCLIVIYLDMGSLTFVIPCSTLPYFIGFVGQFFFYSTLEREGQECKVNKKQITGGE